MRRSPARLATIVGVVLVGLALPSPALAHALGGRVVSPLPLPAYLAAAAFVVALSFAVVLLRGTRARDPGPVSVVVVPRPVVLLFRAIGLLAWLWIVAQLVAGGSSDADVASLFLWVFGWVGLAIVSALVGPVWTWLDPFSTLHDTGAAVVRRLGLPSWEPVPYPEALGHWPAVIGFVFFVWLELAYEQVLSGVVLVVYTFITLLFMAQFGKDAWRRNGETFSVWFATLNRIAPFGPATKPGTRLLERRPFASALRRGGWSSALVVLVALGAASILYDGLSQTQPWYGVFDSPGVGLATVELLAFLAIVAVLALGVARLLGSDALGAGLVPIAIGYLIAHYLTYLLGDGQRILVAISDPFQRGWDLFGTATHEASLDWLPPILVWGIQLAAVVGGHVLGAWSGHAVAARAPRAAADIRLRQVPLAALMVVLTTATLWSLGQGIVVEPAEGAAAVPGRPPVTRSGGG